MRAVHLPAFSLLLPLYAVCIGFVALCGVLASCVLVILPVLLGCVHCVSIQRECEESGDINFCFS